MNAVVDLTTSDLQTIEQPAALAVHTPQHLLHIAVQQGADLDKLERLMALQERWEKNEAIKQFNAAMAAFKAAGTVNIYKDKHVRYQSQKGVTEYDHATIGNVVAIITKALAPHGLSHSWSTRQDKSAIWVTCRLSHVGGHFDEITLSADADQSGGKNAIQAIGSAVSYLQRYTLLLITGCATKDQPDDDGKDSGAPGAEADLVAGLSDITTDDDALAYWKKYSPSLRADVPARNRFKAAVEAKRTQLTGGA